MKQTKLIIERVHNGFILKVLEKVKRPDHANLMSDDFSDQYEDLFVFETYEDLERKIRRSFDL